jgi:hypothetical protein
VLEGCPKISLTRPGQPLHNLPDDFVLRDYDIPDEPEDEAIGRDLPTEVMRNLTAHLDQLEASSGREVRVGTELMMDTGRRPGEIASLWLDCLEADPDGTRHRPRSVRLGPKELATTSHLPPACLRPAWVPMPSVGLPSQFAWPTRRSKP